MNLLSRVRRSPGVARPIPVGVRGNPVVGAALLVTVWPLLLACGERAAEPAPTGGTMVISAFAEPDVLLPPLTLSGQGQQVVDAVFDRLLFPDTVADGGTRVVPMLASAWSWTSDSMAIDFTIHADAKWHDGVSVTASDVRFTWQAYTDSALASPMASSLANIDSVQVRARRVSGSRGAVRTGRLMPSQRCASCPPICWIRFPVPSGAARRFRGVRSAVGGSVSGSGKRQHRWMSSPIVPTIVVDPGSIG
jgi:Bacterial extracellular solute-binding proteins, family 5 Middle